MADPGTGIDSGGGGGAGGGMLEPAAILFSTGLTD